MHIFLQNKKIAIDILKLKKIKKQNAKKTPRIKKKFGL